MICPARCSENTVFHGYALDLRSSIHCIVISVVNWRSLEMENWCKGGRAIALFSEEVFLLSAHVLLGYWVLVVQQIVSNLRTRTLYYLRV